MKVVMQNFSVKGYHEFHVRLHKELEIKTLVIPILLLARVIL